MTGKCTVLDADVVIAGAGPGGCTLARELSKKGKKVVLIEQGTYSKRFFGNPLGILYRMEKSPHLFPIRRTTEGYSVILGRGVGGGTLLYAGSAFLPGDEYWKEYGIEFPHEMIDEAARETWYTMPPDEFIGQGSRRIMQAANDIGIPFEKVARHVDFSKCVVGCSGCVMGCYRDAKWTAMEYADEAVKNGATLLTQTKVTDIVVEDGVAGGVKAKGRGVEYRVNAKVTVCACGGVHTAELLQKIGIKEAGGWFTGDPTTFTFGFLREGKGNAGEHSMTIGWHDEENGVVYCAMASPMISWHMQFLQDEPFKYLARIHKYGKVLSLFEKVSDEGQGRCYPNGKISKTFTDKDWKVFKHAREIAEKILVKAGCNPDDIHHANFVLGHPSSTVKVGELLDTNLSTQVKNLYCCDTSAFPKAPGRPPALTVVVLSKRLARHLEAVV
jgi:choline dehydrogenase-like flavoprotein